MDSSEKNKYDEIIQFLESRLDNCNKILRSTIELKEMLQEGNEEDTLIKKVQERGILINKASSLNTECHSINKFVECIEDEQRRSIVKGLMGKIGQLLDETAILDKENKSLIENKMNEITLNLGKIQESKQLARNLDKNVNDNPSFIDVCG